MLVYCDGGKRKGVGSWAYVIVDAKAETIAADYSGKASGRILHWGCGLINDLKSTAQSEIVAAIRGTKKYLSIQPNGRLVVVSDNMYVVNGFLKPGRMARNERYEQEWNDVLLSTLFCKSVDTQHVKGHAGQTFNALCDWMCGEVHSRDYSKIQCVISAFNKSYAWRSSFVKTRK